MKLSHRLAYLLVRALGILPYRALYFIGWCLGWAYWALSARDRFICNVNMRLFYPELTPKEQRKRARLSMRHISINLMETMWVWGHPYAQLSKKIRIIENLELLEQAEQDSRGLIVMVPHFGSWEIMSHFLGKHCYEAVFLARHFGIPKLDNYIIEGRVRSGGKILATNREGITELYQKTSAGHSTGILSDQSVDKKYGVFAPWMGHPALTGVIVPDLLQKTGSQALFAACKRLPWGQGYHIKVFTAPEEIYSKNVTTSATAMNDGFAEIIAWAPEQYTWNYRRITKRPDGGETRYYDYPP